MTQEVLKLALEALELCNGAETVDGVVIYTHKEIVAIKEALREHAMREVQRLGQEIEQEPIGTVKELFTQTAWERLDLRGSTKVYLNTTPPQRIWVGLTDDEQQEAYEQWQNDGWGVFYNAIEAKLKEKNT